MPTFEAYTTGPDDGYAYLRSGSGPAQLDTDRDLLVFGGSGSEVAILRFPDVPVPQGYVVQSATLSMVQALGRGAAVRLVGEAVDDAPPPRFEDVAGYTGSRTAAYADMPNSGNTNFTQRSADVTAVVQEIVNRPGWAAGNALKFLGKSTETLSAEVYSADAGHSIPHLTIDYVSPNPPVASFLAVVDQTIPAVTVTDTSTNEHGDIVAREWSFGDGGIATGAAATHTYRAGGTFTITLTVTNSLGLTDTTTRQVVVNAPPHASFTFTISGARTVTVDSSASYDPDGPTVDRLIDFGDGHTSIDTIAVHEYATGGDYTITVTVTDEDGAQRYAAAALTLLQVKFDHHTTGLTATFSDMSVPTSGEQVRSLVWDFGDGGTGVGPNPRHSYPAPGEYQATLTLTTSTGAVATHTTTVTVTDLILWSEAGAAWEEALEAAGRTTSAMVEVIDPEGNVAASFGGPHDATTSPVVSGDVTYDPSTPVRWTCSLTIQDESLMPREASDLLHVLSRNRVRVWWMMRLPDLTWARIPVGTYFPSAPSINSDGGFGVACKDAVARFKRARWLADFPKINSTEDDVVTVDEGIRRVVEDRAPWLAHRLTPTDKIVSRLRSADDPGSDPWNTVVDLAASAGMVAYIDRWGVLRVEPRREGTAPVAVWAEGDDCQMTDITRTLSDEELVNTVLAISHSGSQSHTATVDDPNHPLWVGHGHIYSTIITEGVYSRTLAEEIAKAELERLTSLLEQVEVTHRARPDLEDGDVVSVRHERTGATGLYAVQSWSLALGAGSGQRTTLIERRLQV